MEHESIEIIRIYHQSSLSIRALCEIYGQLHRPTEDTIRRSVEKFEMTDSVMDQPTPVHCRNARFDKNIATVRDSVSEDPNLSIFRGA